MGTWAYHQAGIEFVRSLHCPVTEAVAQVLLHKVWVVQDIVCHQRLLTRPQDRRQESLNTLQAAAEWSQPALAKEYLVGDVLLLQRRMAFGVNERWMSHQITPVLHYEAPVPKQVMPFIHEWLPHFQRTLDHITLKTNLSRRMGDEKGRNLASQVDTFLLR